MRTTKAYRVLAVQLQLVDSGYTNPRVWSTVNPGVLVHPNLCVLGSECRFGLCSYSFT